MVEEPLPEPSPSVCKSVPEEIVQLEGGVQAVSPILESQAMSPPGRALPAHPLDKTDIAAVGRDLSCVTTPGVPACESSQIEKFTSPTDFNCRYLKSVEISDASVELAATSTNYRWENSSMLVQLCSQ